MSAEHFDVVIAGGGIVGAATALALAEARMRVALVERDALGSGATAAGMGLVLVLEDSPAQFALTRHSQRLWHSLAPSLGPRAECERCGSLWVAVDDEEMAEAERMHRFYQEHEVPSWLLSGREVEEAEPNLRPGLTGGLVVPEDVAVYPPAAALELAERARELGAEFYIGRSVARMRDGEAVLDNGTVLRAPRLVNATGAWAPELSPGLEVRKRKGHLVITDRHPGFLRYQLAEFGYLRSVKSTAAHAVACNVQPRKTGQLLIGSSRQYGDEEAAIHHGVLAEMLTRVGRFLPAIGKLPVLRAWTGFRAATPDKLPILGQSPVDSTLWLATGHEGLGITTSLTSAQLIRAQMTGSTPPIPIKPYLPTRFLTLQQKAS